MAIGSKYVYEIETEEKIKWWYDYDDYEEKKAGRLKSFIKEWVNEMKKDLKKKYE